MDGSRFLLGLLLASCSAPASSPQTQRAAEPRAALPLLIPDAGVLPTTAKVTEVADASPSSAQAADVPLTKPCASGSAPLRDALDKHARLKEALRVLKPSSDPTIAAERLEELIEHPCLAIARSLGNTPGKPPRSAPALVQFWLDGGSHWLGAELDRATTRTHMLAPAFRDVLDRESHPTHQLLPLLCKTDDLKCAAETAGWSRRANRALAGDSLASHHYTGSNVKSNADSPKAIGELCEKQTVEAAAANRLQAWHACVASRRPTRLTLPLWLPRAPSKGWLVVRGRRGHYSFCDEVRLFSVATGDAYSIQSCSGLTLSTSGGVDRDATDASRNRRFRRGRVNTANLRETLWMLLLIDEAKAVAKSMTLEVPAGINIATPKDTMIGSIGGGSFGSSSAQTTLFWRYVDGDIAELAGTVRWPQDYNSIASTYTTELLRITEDGFVDGCPKKRPPRITRKAKASGVSGLDADPARVALLQSDLFADLRKRAKSRCKRR